MNSSLRIGIVFPESHGVGTGNLVTAQRWASILSELGHEVSLLDSTGDLDCEVLIALNAVKSFSTISRFHHQRPRGLLIVAVTGTDLNQADTQSWHDTTMWADHLVVLQEEAYKSLDAKLQAKATVIVQSVSLPDRLEKSRNGDDDEKFKVCVVGHLRDEKDPMLTAQASRLLDENSRVQLYQAGAILQEKYQPLVAAEQVANPRYHWQGELSREEAVRLIASCDLMVLSSTSEGGPAVIGESVMVGTPILASEIDGAVGLLGPDYPGYFHPEDVEGLAELLNRAEAEPAFLQALTEAAESRRELFDPVQESARWSELLESSQV